jgi:hypothetical protein
MLYLFVLKQFRTENRFTLFQELLYPAAFFLVCQSRRESR